MMMSFGNEMATNQVVLPQKKMFVAIGVYTTVSLTCLKFNTVKGKGLFVVLHDATNIK